MSEGGFDCEVAFSFLAQDEPLATSIANELRERLEVFVYSERQKELAGTDGMEKFSAIFGKKSRVVVVLYREDWGKTKWTGIEEEAIKGRAFDTGWDFLFVVMLDSSDPPSWLPRIKLYWGYERFGLSGLACAIESRVQEAGGVIREESVIERAERLARAHKKKLAHQAWLETPEAAKCARSEIKCMAQSLMEQVNQISKLESMPEVVIKQQEDTETTLWWLVRSQLGGFTVHWCGFR